MLCFQAACGWALKQTHNARGFFFVLFRVLFFWASEKEKKQKVKRWSEDSERALPREIRRDQKTKLWSRWEKPVLAAAGGPAWRVKDGECAPDEEQQEDGYCEWRALNESVWPCDWRRRKRCTWTGKGWGGDYREVLSSYGDVIESNKSVLLWDGLGWILFPTGPTRLFLLLSLAWFLYFSASSPTLNPQRERRCRLIWRMIQHKKRPLQSTFFFLFTLHDFNSEPSLIHLANLQMKAISVVLKVNCVS